MHAPGYLAGRLIPGQRQTLEPLRETLGRLGHPERAVPVVLIGGTNGKGSTQAFLTSILRAAGHRVGVFTSPSLSDFHELIRIDGRNITPDLARALAETALDAAGPDGLTLFEAATAVAFLAFARTGVDLAVVEVGMGGRGDATNLSEPILSIVTNVELDHTAELGGTREAIAWEKAGIARAGRPLITGTNGPIRDIIRGECRELGAPVDALGVQFSLGERPGGLAFVAPDTKIEGLELGLAGRHQWNNAALAIQAARRLVEAGFPVSEQAIREGLRSAYLPGRLEGLAGPDGMRVLVDGAHNPHGAKALASSLDELEMPHPRTVVLAVYADKDLDGMLRALRPAMDRLICTRTGAARCLEPEVLAGRARGILEPDFPIEVAADLAEAVARLRGVPEAIRGTVVVTGSLSVVAEARRAVCGSGGGPLETTG